MGLIAALLTALVMLPGKPPSEVFSRTPSPTHLTACIDERPWIPYTNPDMDHPGRMQVVVSRSLAALGGELLVTALPWKRCLESVRVGKIDAIIGASDAALLQNIAAFPRNGKAVDPSRSLAMARVVLVKRQGEALDWNGHSFIGKEAPTVAVPLGTEIVFDVVKKYGGVPDNGGKTDEQNLRKLLQRRVDLMAAYEYDLEALLSRGVDPKVAGLVTILRAPLAETPYYLVFSKSFFESNPEFADKLWHQMSLMKDQR